MKKYIKSNKEYHELPDDSDRYHAIFHDYAKEITEDIKNGNYSVHDLNETIEYIGYTNDATCKWELIVENTMPAWIDSFWVLDQIVRDINYVGADSGDVVYNQEDDYESCYWWLRLYEKLDI